MKALKGEKSFHYGNFTLRLYYPFVEINGEGFFMHTIVWFKAVLRGRGYKALTVCCVFGVGVVYREKSNPKALKGGGDK